SDNRRSPRPRRFRDRGGRLRRVVPARDLDGGALDRAGRCACLGPTCCHRCRGRSARVHRSDALSIWRTELSTTITGPEYHSDRSSAMASAYAFAVAGLAVVTAQVPGPNVNMVSGKTLPDGDPFLQRQNEPSGALPTRNPLHILAGADSSLVVAFGRR